MLIYLTYPKVLIISPIIPFSAIAPSFAEMGQSVEKIIKECGRCNVDGDNMDFKCSQFDEIEENNDDVEDGNTIDNALSADHVLVLACCWQTLKVRIYFVFLSCTYLL